MRVAIVGGTGPFGRGLAQRLVAAGDDVVIGSRSEERARDAASALGARGARNDDAVADVELIVLAVEADAAVETANALAAAIAGTPVLSVASALRFTKSGVHPGEGPQSIAERLATVVDAPVVGALHSLAAANLAGDDPLEQDALVCGDDPAAKQLALDLASHVVAGRVIDAGPLTTARALEGMTAVIVNVNRRYKAHAGLRLTGLG